VELKDLEQSHIEVSYAQEELAAEKKSVLEELINYQTFFMGVNKEYFNQAISQVAFFYNTSIEDARYDITKDVIDNKIHLWMRLTRRRKRKRRRSCFDLLVVFFFYFPLTRV